MSLIYITGLSGSGKSAIAARLLQKGFDAHDADNEGTNQWYDVATGRVKPMRTIKPGEERTKEWSEKYTWKTSRSKVEKLAKKAKNKLIFLCGTSSNDTSLWDLFDKVICLAISEDEMRKRVKLRTSNDFGKAPHELRNLLEWHKTYPGNRLKMGAILVDANQPLETVVDEILKIAMN